MATAKKPVTDVAPAEGLFVIDIPTFSPVKKVPNKMGTVADLLFRTRATRLAADKLVTALKEQESILKDYVINNLPKSESTGASGKLANVRVASKVGYQAVDWEKIHAYIKKNDAFDLLQKRLSDTAVADRMGQMKKGQTIPGVEEFNIVSVSVTKV